MRNVIRLRKLAILTMVLFGWFCLSPNFSFARQDEDVLLKARRLYQQGYYDDAITLLNEYIKKIKTVAEQKRNVAKAFYQLAKVYFTVGEDNKVKENLNKVFETYPDFQTEETDLEFKERVDKVKKEVKVKAKVKEEKVKIKVKVKEEEKVKVKEEKPKPEKKVIPKPVKKKKKKKFPWLLVIGGVVVAGVLAYFLLFKKKEESKVTDVTIKIDITFASTNLGCRHIIRINGIERFNEFLSFNVPGYDDYDLARKYNRTIFVTLPPGSFTIQHEMESDYTKYYPAQNSWVWATDFMLTISSYNFQGDNPGSPVLSETSFYTTVAPWHDDPTNEWYRIESKTISIIEPVAPAMTGKRIRSKKSIKEVRYIKTRK